MAPRHASSVSDKQQKDKLEEARRVIRGLAGKSPRLDAGARDVTVIVKTFERPACVAMCLASVRAHYPTVPILVCDDGRETLFSDGEEPAPGVRWLTLPFEAGHTLGAGRNYLLRKVTTPFFFLADDDHAFTACTRLDLLAGVLLRHRLDIVGGAQDRGDYGGAIFERKGDLVYQRFHEFHEELEAGVVRCDRISNTFLARTEAVRAIGWEERVHGSEHADFFLRASGAGLRIAQVGYVYVDHRRDCETPTGWLGRWFGRWLAHRDQAYAWLRRGGDQAGPDWLEREREFVHKKNGIRAIVDVRNRGQRAPLEARIGTPYYDRPPFSGTL
jgi:GT2 family glycosyltransferase